MEKIGVFDSGIGGLTVMRALRTAFPGLDMVYLGDTARVPYGGRSAQTIIRYSVDDAEFLLSQGVSAIIIACNTASAVAMDELKRRFSVPVYGVIENAAARAAGLSRTGTVGVIATQATVASSAYEAALLAHRPELQVISQACPLLVPMIENGLAPDDEITELLCRRYLAGFENTGTDVLILGCTHYAVYRDTISRLLPGVTLVNTGEALAHALRESYGACRQGSGHVEYYVTERSVAFNDIVRIMDPEADVDSIRVEAGFL